MREMVIVGAGALGHELLEWMQDSLDLNTKVRFADDSDFLKPWPSPESIVFLAAANPSDREAMAARLAPTNARPSYVHDAFLIASTAKIGRGCLLLPHGVLSDKAVLGQHVVVNTHSSIGHDVEVGDFCTLDSGVRLCGEVKVGNGCRIHTNAVVAPKVTIGDGATIGACSLVLSDVPAGATVFGSPARVVARRSV